MSVSTNASIETKLWDMGHNNSFMFDSPNLNEAILGVTADGNVIYEFDSMVEIIMGHSNMNEDEASDLVGHIIKLIPRFLEDRIPPIISYSI